MDYDLGSSNYESALLKLETPHHNTRLSSPPTFSLLRVGSDSHAIPILMLDHGAALFSLSSFQGCAVSV